MGSIIGHLQKALGAPSPIFGPPVCLFTRSMLTMRALPNAPSRLCLNAAHMAAVFTLAGLAAGRVSAQSIAVQVGDSASLIVAPGARIGIPLRVDLSAAGSTLNLASLQGTLSWGASRLTFDSVRVNPATGFTQTVNAAGAVTGSVALSYFSGTRLTASAALATAWFTASTTPGGTLVSFTPSEVGSEEGGNILTHVVTRALALCVGGSGRWGDVNDDGTVSIIDAQQIARFSVGLSVASPAAVGARGDVNADNVVSVIDAQQIARFSVGLSAAVRINTALAGGGTAASLTLTPSTAQALAVGASVTVVASPRDGANADLTGCAPVTWGSSDPAVASVSASGVVTGVAAGTATITATSGTATAAIAVTVGVATGITGVRVQATAPGPTSRFLIRIDSGGLATEMTQRIVTTRRTLNELVPVPVGSGYRVRVYAVDSASIAPDALPLIGALGVVRGIAVMPGAIASASVTLVAPTLTVSIPDSVTAAQRAVANVAVRYPVRAFPGGTDLLECRMRWASNSFADNADDVGVFAGTVGAGTDSTGTCQAQIPAQGTGGMMFHQVAVSLQGFTANGYELYPTLIAPSVQRGQALRQLRVRALTTGAVVSFTSTVPARRVYAIAMGGTLGTLVAPDSTTMERLRAQVRHDEPPRIGNPGASTIAAGTAEAVTMPLAHVVGVGEVVVRLDGNGLRSGTLTVPLPPGSGYDIRVVTVDSASWVNDSTNSWSWVLGASGRATGITVPASGSVAVPMMLTAPVVSATWPDSVGMGQPISANFSVTDPADLFAGLTTGFVYTWYGRTPWPRNASTQRQTYVGSSQPTPPGSRSWSPSIPSQTAAGVVFLQSSAETFFIDPSGRYVYLDAFDRNLAGGQSLRTLRVGVPALPTCPSTPIALGDSVAGTLAAGDCPSQRVAGGLEDRYSLTATANTPVQIRMRSTAFDTFLRVRNAAGVVVFENDNESDAVSNSLLAVTLPAGSYTIEAGSFEGASTGAYSLVLAQTTRPGQTVTGLASTGGPVLVNVTMPAGAPSLVVRTSGGAGDVDLRVFAGTAAVGTALCSSGGGSTNQVCAINRPAAGTYTIQARPWATSGFTGVTLEVNPTIPMAGVGQTISGLSTSAGVVLYNVTVPAGTPSFTVRTSRGTGDVDLRVFAGEGPAGLPACRSGSASTNQVCAINSPAPGTYTIQVRTWSMTAFSGVTLEVNPTIPVATLGQTVTGLSSNAGVALYNVTVPAGLPSLIVRTSGGTGDVDLRLFAASGPAGLASCSSGGGSTNQVCAINTPAPGTYTVQVRAWASVFSGVNLEVNPTLPVVSVGQTMTGVTSAAGVVLYNVTVPAGTPSLIVRTVAGLGDMDLRIFAGSGPAGLSSCTSSGGTTNQVCSINNPTAGTYTIQARPWLANGFSGVTLEVNPTLPVATLGQIVAGLSTGAGVVLYNVTVPAGTPSLVVRTLGGLGDVDLRIFAGAGPAGLSSCSSGGGSTNQVCAINNPAAGIYTIQARPWLASGFSGVTMEINPVLPVAALGQTVTGLSSASGVVLYNVSIPAGTSSMVARTTGGFGDIDLRIFRGAGPSGTSLCSSFSGTTNQQCVINGPTPGTYTIQLRTFISSAFGNVTLSVNPPL